MLELFTNPMSRGAIARWMLEETGEPYEERIIAYGADMKSPDYLAINPMGKVPALRHDGKIVTECAAICAYLADAFPAAGLGPTDEERADYYRWLLFGAGPLEQAVVSKSLGWTPTDERQQQMLGFGHYDLVVDVLAGQLSGRPYLCGARFTAADVYVGAQVVWGLEFGTLPRRREFEAYAARLVQRDAARRAKTKDQTAAAPSHG